MTPLKDLSAIAEFPRESRNFLTSEAGESGAAGEVLIADPFGSAVV